MYNTDRRGGGGAKNRYLGRTQITNKCLNFKAFISSKTNITFRSHRFGRSKYVGAIAATKSNI